ncbi:MAG: hypothetical protein KJ767_00210 [Nanoarchaeota archaeon]|nr:hypothetical protein [Nanoarchaeota archaeon]
MVDKNIKEAFSKIKEEMDNLKRELYEMKQELSKISYTFNAILQTRVPRNVPNFNRGFIKRDFGTSQPSKPYKTPYSQEVKPKTPISIGNEGVSALRQQTGNTSAHPVQVRERQEIRKDIQEVQRMQETETSKTLQENVEKLKKALKEVFKTLTKQEFYVFSLIYQLEDELKRPVTYTDLANRTNLTPNSLRDYISKLIVKKVPIIKEKINNRQILLKIAPELRNIETLDNLLKIVENKES